MNRVYCFTGYPASGKSTAGSIASDAGYPVIEMGDVVRQRAREELGDDATSEEIGSWATRHREENGNDIFAKYTAGAVSENESETSILAGLRTPNELAVFREKFEEVIVVFIETPFETRLERLQERDREDEGEYTADDLRSRDEREADWGVSELINNGHYDEKINNDSTFEKFESTVLSMID